MDFDLVSAPHTGNETIFLSGPPGAGKTELAVRRLRFLLDAGVAPETILVLLPQRTLGRPYYAAIRESGAAVRVATIAGLAQEMIRAYWPQVAAPAGFAHPEREPQFVAFEPAQYLMDRAVAPFVERGEFEGVTLSRTRLLAQLVDNLDRAAAVGFSLDELAGRLKSAWGGESARERVYDTVQSAALAFRETCLQNNLLDWSLQIEVFREHVLALAEAREVLFGRYRHLLVDNSEEHTPAAHDLLRLWLPVCDSALIVHDTGGGYRVLLAADPNGSLALAGLCREQATLPRSAVPAPGVGAFGAELAGILGTRIRWADGQGNPLAAVRFEGRRFYPEMLDWVVEQVSRRVMEDGVPPEEIALLAPFASDVLRFSLAERLAPFGIPLYSHRPARALTGEPAVRCVLTLAKVAHPGWQRAPSHDELARALALAVADLDPVRARLLADIVYRVKDGRPALTSFSQIVPDTQQRVSRLLGRRYDDLWRWLQENGANNGEEPLDRFVTRLVDDVLAQPGFGFFGDSGAQRAAANLAQSIRRFDDVISGLNGDGQGTAGVGPEYVDRIEQGLIAGQYLASWEPEAQQGVLLTSAVTFLLMNRPVRTQFWLDVGSRAWFERYYQPLSHPYVLSREWPAGQVWTDADEMQARSRALAQLVIGLTYRCRESIYLAFSELNVQGYEQRGPLLQALHRLLARQAGQREMERR